MSDKYYMSQAICPDLLFKYTNKIYISYPICAYCTIPPPFYWVDCL